MALPTFNRILNQEIAAGPNIEDLRSQLDIEEVQTRVETLLSLPGLFNAPDMNAVDEMVAKKKQSGETTASVAANIQTHKGADASSHFLLSDPEKGTLKLLSDVMRSKDYGPMVNWHAPRWSGAPFLARNLVYREGLGTQCEKLYVLRPTSVKNPFDAELDALADIFSLNSGLKSFGIDLLDALALSNSVVIFADAEYIEDHCFKPPFTPLARVLIAARKRKSGWRSSPVIISVGEALAKGLVTHESRALSDQLNQKLNTPSGQRYGVFLQQLDRFSRLRGVYEPWEGGSRLKRAHWHYENITDQPVWPVNIRLRAFFASNRDYFSYFDPTAGFNQLAGDVENIPEDVQCFVNDIKSYLNRIDLTRSMVPNKHQTNHYILQLCSTAKHWLTEGAMKVLCDGNSHPRAKHLREDSLEQAVIGLSEVLRVDEYRPHNTTTEKIKVYAASIGIKAVVHDNWMENDPAGCALAHHRVAKRLYELQNDKLELAKEFPYEPHWGRSRMFFLAECLRHLVRSCAAVEKFEPQENFETIRREMPDGPTSSREGCDPYQIWSFCFGELFLSQLNGNTDAVASRSLAKRHGAYQLVVEILQLLSLNGKIGEPHWALHEVHHDAFLKESAFALLDVGHLDQATDIFVKLRKRALDKSQARKIVDAELNLALTYTLHGDHSAANTAINAAQTAFIKGRRAKIDGRRAKEFTRSRARKAIRRIRGRKAHLHLVNGEYDNAIFIYERLHKEKSLRGELAHCYITSLIAKADQINDPDKSVALREKAMAICIQNRAHSATEGLHHERMGFYIVEATLYRALGLNPQLSEYILDNVYKDIQRYGCSERTYLAFLLEAGLSLAAQGKIIRAYTSYLRPCLIRSISQSHRSEAERSAVVARDTLNSIINLAQSLPNEEWQALRVTCIKEEQDDRPNDAPSTAGLNPRDPLYGFEVRYSTELIEKMIDVGFIRGELARVKHVIATDESSPLPLPWQDSM